MRLWVVEQVIPHEMAYAIAVFDSAELAEQYAARRQAKEPNGPLSVRYEVTEFELNKTPEGITT